MHGNPGRPWVGVLLLLSLLFGWPLAGWGQQRDRVTLKYSWIFIPTSAPIFLGMERGLFAAEGIDLDFQDGRGSAQNLQFLGAKKILIAFADLGTAAGFISQGLPVKAVWGYMQTSPMSVVVHEDLGVRSPRDLEGKKIGAEPADATKAIFPALAERNGVDLWKIQFINVTAAARNNALLARQVDAILAFYPVTAPTLRAEGAKVSVLRYADFGVNVLGMGINAHTSVFADAPDMLRRLLRAVSRSVEESQRAPKEAIAALRKWSPLTVKNPEVGQQELEGVLSLLHTENSRRRPLGWMAKKDWEETLDLLTKHGTLKSPLPAEQYYTNDFISAAPSQ